VANAVRLLKLPEPVKARLADGTISEGHARALQALENDAAMLKALATVTRNALSVRQTEELVRRVLAEPKTKAKKSSLLPRRARWRTACAGRWHQGQLVPQPQRRQGGHPFLFGRRA